MCSSAFNLKFVQEEAEMAVHMHKSVRTCLSQKHVAFRQGRDLKSALTCGVHPPCARSSVVIQSPL